MMASVSLRTILHHLLIVSLLRLAGCDGGPTFKKTPGTHPTTMQVTLSSPSSADGDSSGPVPALIHLDIYQFDVPFGSISTNESFWNHINENRIAGGAGTAELLNKNGLRSGVAPKNDWAYFRSFLTRLPDRTRKITVTEQRVDLMRLDLDKTVGDEDVFVFDSKNYLQGRSYHECVNQMTLSCELASHETSLIHMVLCPVITMHRHRTQFTALNQEYESPFEDVNRFYNMNLVADLGSEEFMIVSPSRDARRSTSVGARFLVNNDLGERLEQVVVIVPTLMRMDGKTFSFTDTSLKH